MWLSEQIQLLSVLVPILGLLAVGLLVSLQSGVAQFGSPQGMRLLLSNLSQVLIRLVGFLVGLVAIHQIIGYPVANLW